MPATHLLSAWTEIGDPRDGRIAVVDAQGAHTYASIRARAKTIAAMLKPTRNDDERIAILVSPGASFVSSLVGAWLSGACVVVLSPLHPAPETAYFLEDANVSQILVSRDLAPRLTAISGGRTLLDPDVPHHAAIDLEPATRPADGADALQLYTSGTTGKPKGAILTHRNLDANTGLLEHAWGVSERDVLLHTLPLHHTHGLVVSLLTTLRAGGQVRMLEDFDAAAVWNGLAHATTFMAVPTIYSKLLSALDGADASTRQRWMHNARNLRLATSGSAALPVTLAERWREITGKIPLERYGMTEIGMALSNALEGERKPGFVGKPLPSVETKIVGSADEGELWVRGPSVFRGYFRREAATSDAFAPSDDDGGERWFMTGDTVRRDSDGTFKILGRTSIDILKSGGYKLSALEIEEVLREHDAVAEVAVIGVPDEEWGDRVVACIVPKPGCDDRISTEEIRAFSKTRLAAYKVPKNVVTFESLPRNAMGKVVKSELVKNVGARSKKS